MKRFLLIPLLALAGIVSTAQAQNFTTVTATVHDPNGIPYANGTISAVLVPTSPGNWSLGGTPYLGQIGLTNLDTTGSFTATFGSNAAIVPGGSQWLITTCSNPGGIPLPFGTGNQCFQVTMTISGATQNISSTLNAAATNLTNFAGTGGPVVSSVSGTLHQIDSTGGLTPTLSLDAAIQLPGSITGGLFNAIVDLTPQTIGTNWSDKLVTGYGTAQCTTIPGCQIQAGDNVAGDGHTTTPSLPTATTLNFTGSGTFTGQMNVGGFSKVYATGALLQLPASGSGGVGINMTTFETLQANDKLILDGLRVDCASQTMSTGILIGAGTAQSYGRNMSVSHCPTGFNLFGAQFGEFHALHAWSDTVGFKIYSPTSGGGGNSDSLDDSVATNGTIGYLFNNLNGLNQGPTYLNNANPQSNSVAGICVTNGSGNGQIVVMNGGAPEVNGGGASSVTIDGVTCKQASTYMNASEVIWNDPYIAEATINPVFFGESANNIVLVNPEGYGISSGNYAQMDATSTVAVQGQVYANGLFQNLTSYPTSIIPPAANQDTKFTGTPIETFNQSIPNTFTGNPLTPAFSDTSGSTSSATAVDPQYGLVNTVTHAASSGNLNSNRFIFNGVFGTTAVTSDWLTSLLIKSSVDCSYTVEDYAVNNSLVTVTLKAGKWTRIVLVEGAIGSGTTPTIDGFPNCASGPTISVTGLESINEPTGLVDPQGYFGTVLSTGAVGQTVDHSFTNAAILPFENTTTATSGANQSSPVAYLCGQLWTGTVSARQCAGVQMVLGSGANPAASIKFTWPVSGGSGTQFVDFTTTQVNFESNGFINSGSWNTGSASISTANVNFTGSAFGSAFGAFQASGTNTAGTNSSFNAQLGTGNSIPALDLSTGGEISTTSGTTVQTKVNRHVVNDTKVSLTSGTPKTIASLNVAADSSASVILRYNVILKDTTGHNNCTAAGLVVANAENSAGTIVATVDAAAGLGATVSCTSGDTLSVTFAITNANPAVLSITPTWGTIVPTASYLIYNYDDLSDASVTP